MATLSGLRTLISNKLTDGDLIDPSSAQIDAQINSTIDYYESDSFWFNEAIASLSTTADNAVLGSIPSDFRQEIMPNGLTLIDNSLHYPLKKMTPLEYESVFDDNSKGRSVGYTYRKGQFELWFIPDAVYTVKLYYRKSYSDLSADGDNNDFTNYAARLIEYKTIADLLRDYRGNSERAMMYDVRVEDEYKRTKRETDNRTSTGYLTTENIVDSCSYAYNNYYS
jgi:hypothetical protein